jgi:inorganic pyrophosphatase
LFLGFILQKYEINGRRTKKKIRKLATSAIVVAAPMPYGDVPHRWDADGHPLHP